MIQFPCLGCRQVFSVSDDEAGRSIQCLRCGILNDVPTHSDLANIAEDGTFKLIETANPAGDRADPLAEAAYAFQKGRIDADGDEIDLRNTPDELAAIDKGPTALEPGQRQRHKPYYDPETGELVRPFELQPDPDRDVDPQSIPLAVPAAMAVEHLNVIDYARRGDVELLNHHPLRRLFEPANLAVMIFVLFGLIVGYAIQLLFISITEETFDVPVWPLNVMFWLALAHFGNTIVAIGPDEHDELPRPLLSLGLWDDILGPLARILGAVLLCYAPALVVLAFVGGVARISALPLMAIGGYFFPAVALTLLTSGSILNLHPDRLRKIMRIGGWRYFGVAAVWIVLFPVYLWATLRVNLVFSSLGIDTPRWKAAEIIVDVPAMMLSVFILHYLCWQLGLLFRAGHDRFGWVWQELLRQRDEDRKQRGSLNAADRAAMRRQRQLRPAGQPMPSTRTGPGIGRR